MTEKLRGNYSPEEKVSILRRYLLSIPFHFES